METFPKFNRLKACRHGMMLYNVHDIYIGRSLDLYGEFSEGEVELFQQMVRPGSVVIEAGANIGAHTVWFAQRTGPRGTVLAFEPQRVVYQTLCGNVALNSLTNVHCFHAAVGKDAGKIVVPPLDYAQDNNFGGLGLGEFEKGESVSVTTIDQLNLSRCDFLKVDVEGMELEVMQGAERTIRALSPILYVENDREEKSDALIHFIADLGYTLYWHRPLLFNPNNFAGARENVFGNVASHNMLCIPANVAQEIRGLQQIAPRPPAQAT